LRVALFASHGGFFAEGWVLAVDDGGGVIGSFALFGEAADVVQSGELDGVYVCCMW
jgi:hypothetical protein